MLDDDLTQLPLTEQAELQALCRLSTDALRTIAAEQMANSAKEQMANSAKEQMAQLMDKNSLGTLSATEQQELTRLVEQGDQLMLRKAEALKLLHERGYKVSTKDFVPSYT